MTLLVLNHSQFNRSIVLFVLKPNFNSVIRAALRCAQEFKKVNLCFLYDSSITSRYIVNLVCLSL